MRKFAYFVLLICVVFSAVSYAEKEKIESVKYQNVDNIQGFDLSIGALLPESMPNLKTDFVVLANSASLLPAYFIKYQGIEYSIGISREDHKIAYIETIDKKFVTPDGVRIGSICKDVLELTKGVMRLERGWADYIPLPSGWNAGFTDGIKKITPETKVYFIFKR